MKVKLCNLIMYSLILIMLLELPVYAKESTGWKVLGMDGVTVQFSGTKEECETYMNYVKGYWNVGSGQEADGTIICLSYTFCGEGIIRFDFENKHKMTWIDGSEWDINYNGSLDYHYVMSLYWYTDDAIRVFCPEFANTHTLIPSNAPENFERVLRMAKEQDANRKKEKTLSKTNEKQENETEESIETFDEMDYIHRYPDIEQIFGTDKQLLFTHYQIYGKAEGRTAIFH